MSITETIELVTPEIPWGVASNCELAPHYLSDDRRKAA
jgi:hypothetical protein